MKFGRRGAPPSEKRVLCLLRLFAATDGAKHGSGCEFSFVWLEAGFELA
jgi:hypothetical protein